MGILVFLWQLTLGPSHLCLWYQGGPQNFRGLLNVTTVPFPLVPTHSGKEFSPTRLALNQGQDRLSEGLSTLPPHPTSLGP